MIEAHAIVGGLGTMVIPTFAAIGMAESGLNIIAHNPIWAPGEDKHLSYDVGWLQFNTWYNRLVTLADTLPYYDPLLCAIKALQLFRSVKPYGAGYARWNTVQNGLHLPYLDEMKKLAIEKGVRL
jgi:hypothetical protein